MSLKKQLLRGGVGSIIVRVIGTGLAFILSIVLARTLGAEGFGTYSFVLSLLIFLSIPLQAGFPNLVVRETAKSHQRNDWLSIKGLMIWILKLVSIYSIGLFMGLIVLYLFDINLIDKKRQEVFLVGLLLIPLIPVILIQNAAIRGLGKVVIGIIPDSVLRPGFALVLISLSLLFYHENLTPLNAMLLYTVSILISFNDLFMRC